ncbi:hypothetical protein A2334_05055 [Candidatus Roizmanbacteria bacterium RIFOXYB2_FULL_38_10]|uniref:50S ribosomal protein L29 n=1 Tax=Candidatus Roizmanbacteria bacterium RIFOXYD1_FULL_38_12 TaxID=1802093 RepID=A0A1F7KZR5_9BACT|nr:MAG: hypothetical protein A3K47_01155 [Candidatus Roizmanbacteria bacterium RIFOXYA2_FULL_38_14]OGK63392.1 MAG: hypothetical protein A3K27_01155 [Candidatus Roizmanbacteria bacterium RIFOXYA1_FULL_37_12]OGK65238.1 MAG: hypothetical protein A3K38_01155 [Candidatus Roizmanbacteria bacterium RIFOXYB1_FULL_40_23]OGK68791.1 MAG: hypothetical protein A2334_05055 [Candidatus Roizmanbacteria bacterium RIFOXYB2_FULL_38_10]OGK69643.1 MAG: hypothetical protein A3K21_01160 [Candidatus Roizmanbacteria ba
MRKITKKFIEKSVSALEKESINLRGEIAKMNLDSGINPQKDTNTLSKKKRELAVLLTILATKRKEEETGGKVK